MYSNDAVSTVEVFHPLFNDWLPVASMLTARSAAVAAAVNGRMYVIGGERKVNNVFEVLAVNEAYDPATDTWTARASLPAPRVYAPVATVNNLIYVIGGQDIENNAFTDVNTTYQYDPASDTWTTKAPMPTARSAIAAAALNGKIYVLGGAASEAPRWRRTIRPRIPGRP